MEIRNPVLSFIFFIALVSGITNPVFAEGSDKGKGHFYYPGYTPIEESNAFIRYMRRPVSEKSKLVFLIERFSHVPLKVIYDGHAFDSKLAGGVAMWFLSQFYNGQTGPEWLLAWCYRTVPGGNIIWAEFSDGTRLMARDILLTELELLEKTDSRKSEE